MSGSFFAEPKPQTPNDYISGALARVLLGTGFAKDEHEAYDQAQRVTGLFSGPQFAYDAGNQLGGGIHRGNLGDIGLGSAKTLLAALPVAGPMRDAYMDAVKTGRPFLMPVVRHEGKFYGGETHLEAIQNNAQTLGPAPFAGYDLGYLNDKGKWLDRNKALQYAHDTGLTTDRFGNGDVGSQALISESLPDLPSTQPPTPSAEPSQLGHIAHIGTGMHDADFWLVRRGTPNAVGSVATDFNPEHIGVKVHRTDIVDPTYLKYAMMNHHAQGNWGAKATGTTNLVNIKTDDVKKIPIGRR